MACYRIRRIRKRARFWQLGQDWRNLWGAERIDKRRDFALKVTYK